MYEQLRVWTRRGYGLQKVALLDDNGEIDKTRVDTRHLVLTPFNEEGKYIYDICEGPWRVFRWGPYKKYGFECDRLDICALSLQVRLMVWLVSTCGRLRNKLSKFGEIARTYLRCD